MPSGGITAPAIATGISFYSNKPAKVLLLKDIYVLLQSKFFSLLTNAWYGNECPVADATIKGGSIKTRYLIKFDGEIAD